MSGKTLSTGTLALLTLVGPSCAGPGAGIGEEAMAASPSFEELETLIRSRAGGIVLRGDGDSRVLVSPRHQGRIFTMKVGAVASTGLVNTDAIRKGEVDPQFNNFGGLDRFWIGPEGGQFGIYFPPGAELDRKNWVVPPAFDRGAFLVQSRSESKVLMRAPPMELTNYIGQKFRLEVEREVGVLRADGLARELGITLPPAVQYAGAYSLNTLTSTGEPPGESRGSLGIWILGQFNPSDSAVIIAPFRPGSEAELGPPFNDDYFGKVSVEAPDRLRVIGNAALLRADSRRVGKLGIRRERTTGLAGAIDFEKGLLTVVQFTVPTGEARYGNSSWVKQQADPFQGDLFQTYNSGVAEKPGELPAVPFYELESTSPLLPFGTAGQAGPISVTHRHATHHFQGEIGSLKPIASQLLGVDLDEVRAAFRLEPAQP